MKDKYVLKDGFDMSLSVTPVKAQFKDGDELLFLVEGLSKKETSSKGSDVQSNSSVPSVEWLHTKVFCEDASIYESTLPVKNGYLRLSHASLHSGFGYLLCVQDREGRRAQTGFDIGTKVVRYGFLTDFSGVDYGEKSISAIRWINRLHLNYVQFYDWAYRHDHFIAPTDNYTDMMGKHISKRTLSELINACHERGINAMAYGAIYGSSNEYASKHPEYRLYDKDGKAIPFFDLLSIMNVNRSCGWHDHILNEYQKALDFGFDGIHMDTYGSPLRAYDVNGYRLDLAHDFRQLVDDAHSTLKSGEEYSQLIFNNVKNWPVDHLASARQTALYIEVWDPYSKYSDIEKLIEHARSVSDLPVILAAYLLPFSKDGSEECYNALRLLTAVITACGASHLLNGQKYGILTQAYYSDYFTADDKHARLIARYYDYITYFAHLWSSRRLLQIPLHIHRSGGNNILTDNDLLSDYPHAGKMWIHASGDRDMTFINLVNLEGSTDERWNQKQNIRTARPFTLSIRVDRSVDSVVYSTPDSGDGIQILPLPVTMETHGGVQYAKISVPSIQVWGTVLIRH